MLPQAIAQFNRQNQEPIKTYFNRIFNWWKEGRYGQSLKTLILIYLNPHALLLNQFPSQEVWIKSSPQELSKKSQDLRQGTTDYSCNPNKNKKTR